jgi:hypothetical protein
MKQFPILDHKQEEWFTLVEMFDPASFKRTVEVISDA